MTPEQIEKPLKNLTQQQILAGMYMYKRLNILCIVVIAALLLTIFLLVDEIRLTYHTSSTQEQLAEDMKQQTLLFDQLKQSLELQKQETANLMQHLSDQLQGSQRTLLQQQNQTLDTMLTQLETELQHLQVAPNTPPPITHPSSTPHPTRHIAQGYTIYGIEPYGVVIQDPQGQFEIAYIGRQLPIGEITEITANSIRAGKWTIMRAVATTSAS